MTPRDALDHLTNAARTGNWCARCPAATETLNRTVNVAALYCQATAPLPTRTRPVIGTVHPVDVAAHDQRRAKARTDLELAAARLRDIADV